MSLSRQIAADLTSTQATQVTQVTQAKKGKKVVGKKGAVAVQVVNADAVSFAIFADDAPVSDSAAAPVVAANELVVASPSEAAAKATTTAAALVPSGDVLSKFIVADLKELCKEHGLAPMRTKAEVLAQLSSLA